MPASPDQLLAQVLAAPDDDAPRRALAAAWRAAGDARGELLEVQLALAGMPRWHADEPALRAREAALLKAHQAAWAAALPHGDLSVRFVRGLAGHVSGSPRELVEHLPALVAVAPITSVAIDFDEEEAEHDGIRELDLAALCACEALGNVTSLQVPESDCSPHAWRRLLSTPVWRRLRELWFGHQIVTVELAAATAAAQLPGTVTTLEFHGYMSGLGDAGLLALTTAPWLGQLRELVLRGQGLGDAGLAALAAAPLAVERLDLASVGYRPNGFSAAAFDALTACEWFAGLTACNLVGCGVGTAAAVAVTRAPRLHRAWLSRTGLGAGDLRVLLGAACWPQLEELSLGGNALGDAGAQMLATAARLPHVLVLTDCGIGPAGLDALAGGAPVAALDLSGNPLTADDWQRALERDRLPRATALMLDGRGFPAPLCDALRQRYRRCDLLGAVSYP